MNGTEEKLRVLGRIARALNERHIVWAVGGSLLLYLTGITDRFNDIDIMADEQDIDRLREALLPMGTLAPAHPSAQYRTHHFLELRIDGVDVDVMAGLVIVRDGVAHDCPLLPQQICGYAQVCGERIPLQSVSDWRRYYSLMGREDKVRLIDEKADTARCDL